MGPWQHGLCHFPMMLRRKAGGLERRQSGLLQVVYSSAPRTRPRDHTSLLGDRARTQGAPCFDLSAWPWAQHGRAEWRAGGRLQHWAASQLMAGAARALLTGEGAVGQDGPRLLPLSGEEEVDTAFRSLSLLLP